MAHHNNTGLLGEKMAVEYLLEKGFSILHQNWWHSHWKVDMIASLKNTLHFIEVKTRRTQKFSYPEMMCPRRRLKSDQRFRRISFLKSSMEVNSI